MNYQRIIKKDMTETIQIKEFVLEDIPMSCTWLVVGPPGSGKCFERGTEVITYEGTIRRVEDVEIGDLLMGDDSSPRKVTRLFRGNDLLFRISPLDGSESYCVTGGHTLCLKYNSKPSISFDKKGSYTITYGRQYTDDSKGYPLNKVKEVTIEVPIPEDEEYESYERAKDICESLIRKYSGKELIHEVEVEEYYHLPKSFRDKLFAYRNNVNYSFYNDDLEVDPYLLGLWLGNGEIESSTLNTPYNSRLDNYLKNEAKIMNLKLVKEKDDINNLVNYKFISLSGRKNSNCFINFLKNNHLHEKRFIPKDYRINSFDNRIRLLSGIIDSQITSVVIDENEDMFYEIISDNRWFTEDLIELSRSLGLCTNFYTECDCDSYDGIHCNCSTTIVIEGKLLNNIPLLLNENKIFNEYSNDEESCNCYSFEVDCEDEDDYFGFELEGRNHRFLLKDFTVVHNCLAPGTPVMMYDNSIKNVEDIKSGDMLHGDDDSPRVVLNTCSGSDHMYRIDSDSGMSYTVNSPHILSLIRNDSCVQNDVTDIDLQRYLKNKEYLDNYYGFRFKNVSNKKKLYSEDNVISSRIEVTFLGKGVYYGFQITGNGRFLLGDGTVTHNTSLIEDFCYFLKHRYPVARVFMGTEGAYRRFSDIMHPLFVSNYYDEQEEKNHILRQRKCKMENPEGYPGNYAINILDDVSDDPKIYKTKVMRGLFKLGSQHWNQLLMVGSQYAIDLPPDVRKSVSYVAIFREPEESERKKLYINLGGSCGKYETFCELMDQLTGDFTCLIIKKRSQSNRIEDNVFWFRTQKLNDWKFGCGEYKEWGKNRYNPKYQEEFVM